MSRLSRYTYIDSLRVICSIFVIATHVIMYYINAFEVSTVPWVVLVFSKATTQCAVPVFFMLSGATILSSTKDEPYGQFIKRRLVKIAIPFLSYSILYYLFYVFVKGEYEFGVAEYFRRLALGGNSISGHFWYIYALIPMYFIFPFLRKMVQNLTKKQLLTLITVIFTICSFFPFINSILSMFSNFKVGYYSYGKAGVYLNYALIGYLIHNTDFSKLKATKIKLLSLLTIVLSVGSMTVMTYLFSEKKINQTYIDITWPFVVIFATAVMVLLKAHYTNKQISDRWANIISNLGMLSFSAYLVHMLYLRTVQLYIPRARLESFSSLESAGILLGIFAVGVILCYIWAYIVSKIPLIKKIL